MTDCIFFKEILDNQAVRGIKEYGEVEYLEDSTIYKNRQVIQLPKDGIWFIFSLDGRFMGIEVHI